MDSSSSPLCGQVNVTNQESTIPRRERDDVMDELKRLRELLEQEQRARLRSEFEEQLQELEWLRDNAEKKTLQYQYELARLRDQASTARGILDRLNVLNAKTVSSNKPKV